jgi:hypothetical protein
MSVSKIQAAISHPSLLTACQMALAVTSGLSKKTCAVSELVTHYRMHTYRPGNLRDAQAHIRAVVQRNNNKVAINVCRCLCKVLCNFAQF